MSRSTRDNPIPLLVADSEQQRPQLRVLSGGQDSATSHSLEIDVRNVRRDLARLLRALQAAGHSVTRWDTDAVSRLAHFDSVTARYLLDGRGERDEVRLAFHGLRAIERWIDKGLSAAERSEVRAFELVIRIEDGELHEPLLRPHHAPEEHSPQMHDQPPVALRSLRAGLRALTDEALVELGRRLGVPPLEEASPKPDRVRDHLTEAIVDTLRDDHLLAILLATLDGQAQRVLLELVRGELNDDDLEQLAKPAPLALVVGGEPLPNRTPLEILRACGLVFGPGGRAGDTWVPVELQPRIDGVLRGLGL